MYYKKQPNTLEGFRFLLSILATVKTFNKLG